MHEQAQHADHHVGHVIQEGYVLHDGFVSARKSSPVANEAHQKHNLIQQLWVEEKEK